MNKFKFWDLFFLSFSILYGIIATIAISVEISNDTPNTVLYYFLCLVLFSSIWFSLSYINDQLK